MYPWWPFGTGEVNPYSNFHDLNQDWIIHIAKDFLNQYTHIQEIITQGETSLDEKTTDGLQSLETKKNELEALLQEWYNSHSSDIASALASALDDINAQLTSAIGSFNQSATAAAQAAIETIPADYSTLAALVYNLRDSNALDVTPTRTGTYTHNGITYEWNADGSCYVHGTATSASRDPLFDSTSALPAGWTPGERYYVEYPQDAATRFQVLAYDGSSHTAIYASPDPNGYFDIPTGTVGMWVRLWIASGTTVNETVKPYVRTALTNKQLTGNTVDLAPEVEELQDAVEELKQNELTLNLSSTSNLNRSDFWEAGSISPSTGENVASSERIRTISYLPTNVADIKMPDKTRGFFICGYDEHNNFVGVYNSSLGWTIDNGNGYDEFNTSVIYHDYPTYRLRIYVYPRNSVPVNLAEANNIFMSNIYNQLIEPHTIRIMQYNIGGFNFGQDGGYAGTDLGLKLSNYRKLMAEYQPDILCLQEYRQYVDSGDSANADYIIFNDVLPYKSLEEHGYVTFMHYQPDAFRHTYLHTEGDYPSRMVYGSIVCNNTQVAIGTAALNALGGSSDAAMKKRALAKMINLLSSFETAIVGIDANPSSQAEADAIKTYMKENGYRVANWDYFGYKDTYNSASADYKAIDTIFIKGKARFTGLQVMPSNEYNGLLSDHLPIIADVLIYK